MTQAHGIRAHGQHLCISEGLCGTTWAVEDSEREFQIYVSVSWEEWLLWEARSPETQGMTEWIQ